MTAGQVWVDVAPMLAAAGQAIADIGTLRQQAARRDGVPADGVAESR
jgi:hypothetical protein